MTALTIPPDKFRPESDVENEGKKPTFYISAQGHPIFLGYYAMQNSRPSGDNIKGQISYKGQSLSAVHVEVMIGNNQKEAYEIVVKTHKYVAPYLLESWEDASFAQQNGVDFSRSLSYSTSRFGWRGPHATDAFDAYRQTVKDMVASHRPDVTWRDFPAHAKVLEALVTWDTVRNKPKDVITVLKERIAESEKRIAELEKQVKRLVDMQPRDRLLLEDLKRVHAEAKEATREHINQNAFIERLRTVEAECEDFKRYGSMIADLRQDVQDLSLDI